MDIDICIEIQRERETEREEVGYKELAYMVTEAEKS